MPFPSGDELRPEIGRIQFDFLMLSFAILGCGQVTLPAMSQFLFCKLRGRCGVQQQNENVNMSGKQ